MIEKREWGGGDSSLVGEVDIWESEKEEYRPANQE
jgi:hypothetical protein